MKLIPFRVETKKITEDAIDYESLGIARPVDDDVEIELMYYNYEWLKTEVMHIYWSTDKTVISLWDGMCIHVREPLNEVIIKLNDTE